MSGMKPCPFCGKEGLYFEQDEEGETNIVCDWCEYKTRIFQTIGDAARWWNTRPIEDDLRKRIAELEKALNIDTDLTIAGLRVELRDATARIAELEEDKRSLRDSNLWLKQNYEDLERDYGVMHEKMCARIDKLKGVIEISEDQQREAKNILIDKNLHIDSLYEEGYKLQQRIAELEAENDQLTARWRQERQDDKSSNDTQTQTIVYGKVCEE